MMHLYITDITITIRPEYYMAFWPESRTTPAYYHTVAASRDSAIEHGRTFLTRELSLIVQKINGCFSSLTDFCPDHPDYTGTPLCTYVDYEFAIEACPLDTASVRTGKTALSHLSRAGNLVTYLNYNGDIIRRCFKPSVRDLNDLRDRRPEDYEDDAGLKYPVGSLVCLKDKHGICNYSENLYIIRQTPGRRTSDPAWINQYALTPVINGAARPSAWTEYAHESDLVLLAPGRGAPVSIVNRPPDYQNNRPPVLFQGKLCHPFSDPDVLPCQTGFVTRALTGSPLTIPVTASPETADQLNSLVGEYLQLEGHFITSPASSNPVCQIDTWCLL